ncbi:MAG: elongation factor G [Verrucomicrobia bacterium]|nr:elongation factor G [Verrucomicrobiota bacterium]
MGTVVEQSRERKGPESQAVREAKGRRRSLPRLRNLGIIAHIDAGKTTVTERMLYYTGRVYKMGEVHEGTATMDWMIQEQERGITITSAATTCFWRDHQVNILDTPGHIDFTVEVQRSLRVLDGAIGVFCGVGGVQPQSETVWHQAKKFNVPCLAFVNKLDRPGAKFDAVMQQMRERLAAPVVALQIPWGSEESFRGLVDLVRMRALDFDADSLGSKVVECDIPAELAAAAEKARHTLVEVVADKDEEVMQAFMENMDVPAEILRAGLRRATLACTLVPVLGGAALRNRGIQPLLDAVVEYLPSPLDVAAVQGHHPRSNENETRETSDLVPMSALAFKIATDPYVGRLTFVRVYSGILKKGQNVFNPRTRTRERVGRLVLLHANHREDVEVLYAGEIGGIAALKQITTGDTLCAENQPIVLERIEFPEPVMAMAIEPRTQADRAKLAETLVALSEEDPTFKVATDAETGQTLIKGMGELHLEIIRDRMNREFHVQANAGKPMVAYRETIRAPARAEHLFQREIGGHGQQGHVVIEIEPQPRAVGNTIEFKVTATQIPGTFREAVEQGLQDGLMTGIVGNYPLTDVKVRVVGGSFHPVDSSELGYRTAAVLALREAAQHAEPTLLEPIMKMEIITPEEFLGDVLGDVNSRRGQVRKMEAREGVQIVQAEVPLAELFGYTTSLRSLTKGRASCSMEPFHFEIVPDSLQKNILNR